MVQHASSCRQTNPNAFSPERKTTPREGHAIPRHAILRSIATRLATHLGAGLVCGLILWSPIAAKAEPDPACDPIFAAITKLLQTPNHQFMSQSSATDALNNGGRLRTSESISTADASYIKVRDHWLKVPLSPQDMLKQQEDGRREAKESCHYLRDDDLEGNAALYTAHTETPKGTSDVQMWISKTTGLPVREEVDLDFSEPGKSHSSIRFDYEHVELPKELQ